MSKIFRLLILPLGFFNKLIEVSNLGARDLQNKFRFKGAIIDKGCNINPQSKIEENVHILDNCIINNSSISSYTYVGRNSIIQNAKVGKFCSIANDVFVGLGKHPLDFFSTSPLFYRRINTFSISLIEQDIPFEEYKPIIIGNDVWIGARSIILDGVTIGHGAVIAANSVITKDVPPYAIVGGTPGKIIKYRFTPEKIENMVQLNWWDWSLERITKEMIQIK